ncbi:MAG: uroporphyrinogen decarboxylase family protein [Pirellulaceae bacterium]|jgi:hypothetical protein|nr:uroporphyrinogen decarboxylase family protein [Pirellulaceae bacterium]MDP7226816.1 uroporphyrinogen decarboxylase family protein [SAR202 cluster bacterium]HJN65994.1 uroporphyrinogen decarboxylase family protein [Pirellulales bacterium]
MNSRERIEQALNHQPVDRIPLDLGATPTSGMHVSSVYLLRQALKLDEPGTPVRVIEPYQMLGEIKPDLMDALGVDVVGLWSRNTLFGFENKDWKSWTLFDGTPLLVPGAFNTEPEENGDILMYPEGDQSVPPSSRMPKDGYYFDSIIRQEPIDEATLDVRDNLEEFGPVSDEDLRYFADEAARLESESDRAMIATFGGTAFGDIALVPAPWLKHPKGIRDIEEWYVSTVSRSDYIQELFTRQCDIAMENLKKFHDLLGDRVTAVFLTGTDFGAQNGPFISCKSYCSLYKPHQKRINDWIHENTSWKTFIHSCGAIVPLLPDIVDAGFDILNPVQCSATGMDPATLKDRFGEQLTFWGGGVDTQKTLPFGTPEEIRDEVRERIEIFGQGSGFVFNTVHNVQARTPQENIVALYETIRDAGSLV